MIFRGKVWRFGNDVDTDVIIPVKYCIGNDPEEFGKHCMEGIDPSFTQKISKGDIIIAGSNFGCGSSREPAPIAIKRAGISCIIAETFGRIFYRNAFNVGLPLLESSEAPANIREGDDVEVDLDSGVITDFTLGRSFQAKPVPSFMQDLLKAGGLMNHVARRLGLS
jgi:3-isopropylmalate/(R)-2-methylmalate dehydratase small subunit